LLVFVPFDSNNLKVEKEIKENFYQISDETAVRVLKLSGKLNV